MTTISQIVDSMLEETRQLHMLAEVTRYVNQTVRELHFNPENNRALKLRENFRESRVYADAETGFVWKQPKPGVWQCLGAVRYDLVSDATGGPAYVPLMTPGRAMNHVDLACYQVGDSFCFKGYGGLGASISIGWYEYPPALVYYPVIDRPLSVTQEGNFVYDGEWGSTDEGKLNAAQVSTNWILLRWASVVEEGVRAKIHKRNQNTEAARTCYSLYQSLRAGFISAELATDGDYHE